MKFLIILIGLILVYVLLKQLFGTSEEPVARLEEKPPAPEGWSDFYAVIEGKGLPSVHIDVLDHACSSVEQSKFGGKPYWPVSRPFPVDPQGNPLIFIAQINCADMYEELEHYPKKGLLQFFIGNNDVYGAEFFTNKSDLETHLAGPKHYAVVYHKEIAESVDIFDEKVVDAHRNGSKPHSGESAISLKPIMNIPSPTDYRYSDVVSEYGAISEEIEQYAHDHLVEHPAHKLGGYGFFTQADPRGQFAAADNWRLLFQMDSQKAQNIDIIWGDLGVANFLILEEDLKALNFDNVWFNWDCG
jgi:uncharacterized protein YwqG